MFFKKSPQKFWDLISSMYAATPIADESAYEIKIEKIKTYLSPESLVLDIGCATGTQCLDLAANVKYVSGIDISAKLLAIAEQRKKERKLDNVEFICTSFYDQRFPVESFDLVMAFYVFHFIEDINAAFKRIYELLKPGGLFVVETSCLGEKKNKTPGKLLQFAGGLGFFPRINLLTTEQQEQALVQAGFEIIDKIMFSQTKGEYTLFAKKTMRNSPNI